MKRPLIIALLVLLLCTALFVALFRGASPVTTEAPSAELVASNSSAAGQSSAPAGEDDGQSPDLSRGPGEGVVEPPAEIEPASKAFKSYEEALAAVKKGATEQDDILLEQFRLSGSNCSFCPELFAELQRAIGDSSTPPENLAYFSQVLAISGDVAGLRKIAEEIRKGSNPDLTELFAQSFEFASGTPEVIQYLTYELQSPNERLREASVAALTNQNSQAAARALYQHTVTVGDPVGYSDVGIGLAEFVPDEETLPFLQEIVVKRDAYSHLGIKSLLNGGLPGLTLVFETIASSPDLDRDRAMLKGAIDHVVIDDETEQFVRARLKDNSSPLVQEFAKEILDRIEGLEFAGEEQPQV